MYYECHITIEPTTGRSAKALIEAHRGWSFSCISGDPDLGEGVREYATYHARATTDAFLGVHRDLTVFADTLRELGYKVVRRKIELVMFDTRGREL